MSVCVFARAYAHFAVYGDVKKLFVRCLGFAFGLSGGTVGIGGHGWGFLGQIRTKDVMPLRRQRRKGVIGLMARIVKRFFGCRGRSGV